jgi:hypothetical protein
MPDMARLQKSFKESRRRLRQFRDRRKEALEEYTGPRYGGGYITELTKKQFIPNITNVGNLYVMYLAANAPQGLITTWQPSLKPFAYRFQQNLNRLVERINLESTIQLCVLDTYLGGLGVAKTYLADGLEVEVSPGIRREMGYPGVERVSPKHWCHDMSADAWGRIQYAGHSYDAFLDDLKKDDRVDPSELAKITARTRRSDDEDRDYEYEDIEPTIRLWELWYPRENKVYTFVEEEHGASISSKPIAEQEWTGSEYGPYQYLGLLDVPDFTMPIAPVTLIHDLHQLDNALMRKHAEQARQAKNYIPYGGEAEEDVKRLAASKNGGFIRCDHPDKFGVSSVPGVDPANFNFQLNVEEALREVSGNLQAIGGGGPMSPTASQDKMINDNVSATVAKMQARVNKFTAGILRDLGYLMWDHEGLVIPNFKTLPGNIQVDMSWTPAVRRGRFVDYNFNVLPFSQAYQSPNDRINGIYADLQAVTPFLESFAQQGGTLNGQKLWRLISEYRNRPEQLDIWDWQTPLNDRDAAPSQSHERTKPAVTHRINERISRPGTTKAGRNQIMGQLAMGSNLQPQQRGPYMPMK